MVIQEQHILDPVLGHDPGAYGPWAMAIAILHYDYRLDSFIFDDVLDNRDPMTNPYQIHLSVIIPTIQTILF